MCDIHLSHRDFGVALNAHRSSRLIATIPPSSAVLSADRSENSTSRRETSFYILLSFPPLLSRVRSATPKSLHATAQHARVHGREHVNEHREDTFVSCMGYLYTRCTSLTHEHALLLLPADFVSCPYNRRSL